MGIDVDKGKATKLLYDSLHACEEQPVEECSIQETIDFVMKGNNCLTYRYIMFTALLAKAVNPAIDILSLQAGDGSEGSYDARSLTSKVVYPFQKRMLGNALNGMNSDPLVNKPARYTRLSMGVFKTREFMSDLLGQGFGGAALVLVATALYHLQFEGDEFKIEAHPVNQSGSSKRQFSDLDLFRNGKPFMGTELKDKPFTNADIDHAAETAYAAGAKSLLFIAGRQSTFSSQPLPYFNDAREKYAAKGMYVGITSIDALLDTVFASHTDMDSAAVLKVVCDTAEEIGKPEAQMWVYEHMNDVSKHLGFEYVATE